MTWHLFYHLCYYCCNVANAVSPGRGKRGGRRKDGALHIMRHLQKAAHRLHTGLPSPPVGFLRLLAELVDALLLARVDDEQVGARGQVAERKHMLRSSLLHGVFHQGDATEVDNGEGGGGRYLSAHGQSVASVCHLQGSEFVRGGRIDAVSGVVNGREAKHIGIAAR